MQRSPSAYSKAVEALLGKLAAAVFGDAPPSPAIVVAVAGGAAAHFYTAARVSRDVDAEFFGRFFKPDVVVMYAGEDGAQRSVHLDRAYSPTLGLMHEDYVDRLQPSDWKVPGFDIQVLAPVDLAISKLGRWAEHDRTDVKALVDAGLIDRTSFETLATEALSYYVGNTKSVRLSLKEALALFPGSRSTKGRHP